MSKADKRLENIAKEVFEDGFELKHGDRFDFAELSKGQLRRMLEQAYEIGKQDGGKS